MSSLCSSTFKLVSCFITSPPSCTSISAGVLLHLSRKPGSPQSSLPYPPVSARLTHCITKSPSSNLCSLRPLSEFELRFRSSFNTPDIIDSSSLLKQLPTPVSSLITSACVTSFPVTSAAISGIHILYSQSCQHQAFLTAPTHAVQPTAPNFFFAKNSLFSLPIP